ncbi:DedA family protein [Micromonospora sp. NBC_01405]|uniref:DedA family protein n=1 Tax=Micromonospora sp. NBC_01405 TaxID=2903589 RepID=UPI00324B0C78
MLTAVPPLLVYAIVAVLVCAETALLAGVAVPTLSTLLLVGFLSRTGGLDLWVALLVSVLAGLLGDHLGYWTGRRQGVRLRATVLGRRISADLWDRADEMIKKHGGRAALAGRFVTVVRTLVPHLCGAAGMPYRSFARWNLPGVVGWASLEILAGYAAGSSYQQLSASFGHATGALALLAAVGLCVVLAGRWLARNPDPVRQAWQLLASSDAARRLSDRCGRVGVGWGPRRVTALTLGIGLAVVLAAGWAMTEVAVFAVRLSGLDSLDGPVAAWFADRQELRKAGLAIAVGSMTVTWLFLVGAFFAALVVTLRRLDRRPTLLDALAALGPVIPLFLLDRVLTLTEDRTGPTVFFSFDAVVTAALALLAWSRTRGTGRVRSFAVGISAGTVLLVLTGSRLHVGWGRLSEAITSLLLGSFWAVATIVVIRIRQSENGSSAQDAQDLAVPDVQRQNLAQPAVIPAGAGRDTAARSQGGSR